MNISGMGQECTGQPGSGTISQPRLAVAAALERVFMAPSAANGKSFLKVKYALISLYA